MAATEALPSVTPLVSGLHLHIDCASGAAGDMLLGACLDLGVPLATVTEAIALLGISPRALVVKRCIRGGIAATDLTVDTSVPVSAALRALTQDSHLHHHGQGHDEHSHDDDRKEPLFHSHAAFPRPTNDAAAHRHYHYGAIRSHIAASELTDAIKQRALAIFDCLASAEAALHGTTKELVSLHEVGALDSIVDIVGTAAALTALAPLSVSCSAVAMGDGTLHCAHGILPVPAPAALHIMTSARALITGGGISRELCTPTGAAILATTVKRYGGMPTGVAVATGWGAGDAELADRPNVVRLTLLNTNMTDAPASDDMWQLQSNIDDMNPQLCSFAAERMFEAGAVDVWWSTILMKKGRPALCCEALVHLTQRDQVIAALLANTTSIGLRYWPVQRTVLQRRWMIVTTTYGDIRIKVASSSAHNANISNAAEIEQAHPEFDDVVAAASKHDVSVKVVMAAAQLAWYQLRSIAHAGGVHDR